MSRSLRLILLFGVLGAFVVVPPVASACVTPYSAAVKPATRLIRYTTSQATNPIQKLDLNVNSRGRVTRVRFPPIVCGSPSNYTLTTRQLTKLKTLISSARFSSLSSSYTASIPITGGKTETVKVPGVATVAIGPQAKGVPSRLTKLLVFLRALGSR
jgi:hypothetical protein